MHCVGNFGIYVGNYKIAAKLYCRLTWKRLTGAIATLTKHYYYHISWEHSLQQSKVENAILKFDQWNLRILTDRFGSILDVENFDIGSITFDSPVIL